MTAKPGFVDEPLSENDPAPENGPVIDPARPDDLDSEEEVRLGDT